MTPSARPIPIPAAGSGDAFVEIDILKMSAGAAYHTMNAIIVPRPIAFITTISPGGVVNAAPFSYFNGVTSDPPTISVSITRRAGALKDTARNIRAGGCFVVNFCSVALAHAVSAAAADLPPEQSEVELTGLSLLPGVRVEAPRIANALVHMECELDQIIEVGRGPVDLVLGRVLLVHTRGGVLDAGGRIDVARLDPLARLAGNRFAGLRDHFDIPRGV